MEEVYFMVFRYLGMRIQIYRVKLGMSRAELAKRTKLSENFICSVEHGVRLPSLKRLIIIARVLQVNMDDLFADLYNEYAVKEGDEENDYGDICSNLKFLNAEEKNVVRNTIDTLLKNKEYNLIRQP